MSAIAADLFPSKPRSWGWLIPVILGLIMSMGMFVSKTKTSSGGGESASSACDDGSTADDHYILDGGSGDGSAWNNALDVLPSSLTRGDDYYIGDGTYPSYTFDDALSGTSVINLCKATVADHGTATGWADTMGDGQATWDKFTINTAYLVIDGATRDESDWWDETAYGFRLGTGDDQVQIEMFAAAILQHDITIQYVYLDGYPVTVSAVGAYGVYANFFDEGNTNRMTNMVYRRMLVTEGSNGIVPWYSNGTLIEYVAMRDVWSNDNNHGDPINAYFTVDDLTVRYSKFRNTDGTAVIAMATSKTDGGFTPSAYIYGNTVEDSDTGDGTFGFAGNTDNQCDFINSVFANNTIVGGGAQWNNGITCAAGSGNIVRNNLWINNNANNQSISVGSGATITHNATSESTIDGTSGQVNLTSSIFVNYAARDLRLASNTNAGANLGAPYDSDLLGNTRTTWSRGAYEYQP